MTHSTVDYSKWELYVKNLEVDPVEPKDQLHIQDLLKQFYQNQVKVESAAPETKQTKRAILESPSVFNGRSSGHS